MTLCILSSQTVTNVLQTLAYGEVVRVRMVIIRVNAMSDGKGKTVIKVKLMNKAFKSKIYICHEMCDEIFCSC